MGVGANLNYIKKIFTHPCATPALDVMIETAIPAAAVALLEVFTFGCSDILKMRAGKSPWHSRSLNGLIKGATGGLKMGPRLFGFYAPFAAVQAGLQYMLFADAASGFVANWMSLMYQQQGCTLPGAGYFRAGLSSTFQDAGGPYGILINALENRQCAAVGGNVITIPAGCEATISWTTHFEPFQGNPANEGSVTTWLQDVNGDAYSVQPAWKNPNGKGWDAGGGAKLRSPFPGIARQYRLSWTSSGGLMGCTSGHLSVSAYGRKMALLPTGCSPRDFDQPYPH